MKPFTLFTGQTGRVSLSLGQHLLGVLGLFGRIVFVVVGILTGRIKLRKENFFSQLDQLGIGSLNVTLLAAATVGISLVFLSLEQLKNLGGLPLLAYFFAKALLYTGITFAAKWGWQIVEGWFA